MATYVVHARGKVGAMSVVVGNATIALEKIRDLAADRFTAMVFDDRGRERSLAEIEAEASNEARTIAPQA